MGSYPADVVGFLTKNAVEFLSSMWVANPVREGVTGLKIV